MRNGKQARLRKLADYYLKQKPYIVNSAEYEIQSAIQYTSKVANACEMFGKAEFAKEINRKLEAYYASFVGFMQPGAAENN